MPKVEAAGGAKNGLLLGPGHRRPVLKFWLVIDVSDKVKDRDFLPKVEAAGGAKNGLLLGPGHRRPVVKFWHGMDGCHKIESKIVKSQS